LSLLLQKVLFSGAIPNNSTVKKSLLFALCGLLLISCQKEFSLDEGAPPVNPGNSICFECDYSPICDSTEMKYVDSSMGTATELYYVYDLLSDTTINGLSFKKTKELNSGAITYFSCVNQVLKGFTYTATSVGGTTVTNIMQTPLKSNEAVGASWTDVLNANGLSIEYRYKIIQKNISRQVFDSTYSNVIYVRDTTVATVPLIGEMAFGVRHMYYAKGIGMIEARMEDLILGGESLVRKLKTYRIRR
jgi:hypothetical protein